MPTQKQVMGCALVAAAGVAIARHNVRGAIGHIPRAAFWKCFASLAGDIPRIEEEGREAPTVAVVWLGRNGNLLPYLDHEQRRTA